MCLIWSETPISHHEAEIPRVSAMMLLYEPRHEKTGFFAYAQNKDADQLRGNREADQSLCFRYTDSTIPLLPKSEISNL